MKYLQVPKMAQNKKRDIPRRKRPTKNLWGTNEQKPRAEVQQTVSNEKYPKRTKHSTQTDSRKGRRNDAEQRRADSIPIPVRYHYYATERTGKYRPRL